MKILILDNYDSFTYNLYHLVRLVAADAEVEIRLNDALAPEEALCYDRILLSPGPGLPAEAGVMPRLIRVAQGRVPILGICLGHQALAEAAGGHLVQAGPFHGLRSRIHIVDRERLFRSFPPEVEVGRYHSWVVSDEDLPRSLRVTARDDVGRIMAIEHCDWAYYGVQFHPESYMTEYGARLMSNFLYR